MESWINQPKPDAEKTFQQIRLLNAVEDTYGGVKVDVEESMDCNVYVHLLRASTTQWRKQGKKGVWIKLPIQLANLVEPTVKEGFRYHHAESDYLMLVQWIPETPDTLPANASHTVGIGAFVVNDTGEEEQQINVEISRAAAAEEEAQGKGLVDGIMEVQKVTESSGDTAETRELNAAMEMETQTTTHSNPSLENAESSRKTKTILEWTLIITSLLLEATSASFDQRGYPLTSMVMAYLALLLSILDLINKARDKEGTTHDGRSLPYFYRHHSHNRKPFGVVEYFGFAGAVWQCSHTTVGYHYSRQNLDNPIKICLLPFIFALCMLISKAVKSNQHER